MPQAEKKMTFGECRWKLRSAGAACSALSFAKDGKCCLHDRTARDYSVAAEPGARHTVKKRERERDEGAFGV
jgi:hypothetical protein